jgi:hypothetical protein
MGDACQELISIRKQPKEHQHMRRKILMGVLALALPVGTLAALTTAAQAKQVVNPVQCNGFSGTVTFATPISAAGELTTSSKSGPTVVGSSSFTCTGGTAPNTGGAGTDGAGLSIKGGKNAKNPSYSKSACKANPGNTTDCDKYVTGSQAEFTAAGGSLAKSVKTIPFTIGGQPATFKAKGSSEDVGGPCGGDVGFTITGQVKGAYGDKTTAQIVACLGADTGPGTTGSFGVDLFSPTATVVTATIDPAVSNATL